MDVRVSERVPGPHVFELRRRRNGVSHLHSYLNLTGISHCAKSEMWARAIAKGAHAQSQKFPRYEHGHCGTKHSVR